MQTDTFDKSFNAFSGVDMIVTFGGVWVGELQGVSYASSREKVGTWTMGNPNVRGFSRGKRGISGSLIFSMFDNEALLEAMNGVSTETISPSDREAVANTANNVTKTVGFRHYDKSFESSVINPSQIESVQSRNVYADQILPFNIKINGLNEYGKTTNMEIIGVELMSSGSGISIDDIQITTAYSFLARDIRNFKNGRGSDEQA